jgi:hypothetical protein
MSGLVLPSSVDFLSIFLRGGFGWLVGWAGLAGTSVLLQSSSGIDRGRSGARKRGILVLISAECGDSVGASVGSRERA